jgi:hypothetical protein
MRRLVSLSLLVVAAAPLSGCIAIAAGAAGGYAAAQYARNDDVRDYAAGFARTWPAVLASMRDAGYPVALDAPGTPPSGRIAITDAVVDVLEVAVGTTRVRVRVGTFTSDAHRRMAGQIHAGIATRVAGS